MELKIDTDKPVPTVTLPRSLEIADVAEAKQALQQIVDLAPAKIAIDLDHVISVDTASLQMLVSFVSSLESTGVEVQWDNLSVPMYMVACQLNLEEHLKL
jgi:anti-anti-sigma regulatory factor